MSDVTLECTFSTVVVITALQWDNGGTCKYMLLVSSPFDRKMTELGRQAGDWPQCTRLRVNGVWHFRFEWFSLCMSQYPVRHTEWSWMVCAHCSREEAGLRSCTFNVLFLRAFLIPVRALLPMWLPLNHRTVYTRSDKRLSQLRVMAVVVASCKEAYRNKANVIFLVFDHLQL